MLVGRHGRLVAHLYLVLVFGAVMTWLVGGSTPDAVYDAGFVATIVLTLPLGYLGYGVIAVAAMALTGAGAWASVVVAVLAVLVFMGAAVVNVIALRGLCRWCSGRREARRLGRTTAAAPWMAAQEQVEGTT